eukprot:13310541-Alexandrium_andersonii.AAC.1
MAWWSACQAVPRGTMPVCQRGGVLKAACTGWLSGKSSSLAGGTVSGATTRCSRIWGHKSGCTLS